MTILIQWLLYTIAVIITAALLPGIHINNFFAAFLAALVLGILNVYIKPLLLILTLPINILTLGIFTLVINAVVILIAASIVPGFQVDGFWWALLFSIVLAILNTIISNASSAG